MHIPPARLIIHLCATCGKVEMFDFRKHYHHGKWCPTLPHAVAYVKENLEDDDPIPCDCELHRSLGRSADRDH